MNQTSFDLMPRARIEDPPTSHRAARNARQFAAGHAQLILDALAAGPATYKEIAQRCGLEPHAVARRLKEIEHSGKCRRTDDEREGCVVWAAGR